MYNPSVKRAVGLLLVLFIFYGTTVEAAHRHGVAAPHSNSTTSVTNPNSGANSTFTKPGCSDCLICQLHQNFSATLISVKLNDAAPLARVTPARRFDPVPTRSIANSPQTGRAPPQAN